MKLKLSQSLSIISIYTYQSKAELQRSTNTDNYDGFSLMDFDHLNGNHEFSDFEESQEISDLFLNGFQPTTTEIIPETESSTDPAVLENKYNLSEVISDDHDYLGREHRQDGGYEANSVYEVSAYEEELIEDYVYYDYYSYAYGDDYDEDDTENELENGWTARRKKKQKKPAAGQRGPATVVKVNCFTTEEDISNSIHHFLPFGPEANDQLLHRTDTSEPIPLNYAQKVDFKTDTGFELDFMGRKTTNIEIGQSYMGLKFTVGDGNRDPSDIENLLFVTPFINSFQANTKYFNGNGKKIAEALFDQKTDNGAMWFRILNKSNPAHLSELNMINKDVIGDRDFRPSIAFILTVIKQPNMKTLMYSCKAFNNFQVLVVGDGKGKSYTMVNYGFMAWGGYTTNNRAGFSRSHPASRIISGTSSTWHHRFSESNVEFAGRYVYDTSRNNIVDSLVTLDFNVKPKITYTDFSLSFETSTENIQTVLDHTGLVDHDFMTKNIQPHGCWCGKFLSNDHGFGGQIMDEVDSMCKQWHQCRACSRMKSCDNKHLMGPFTVRHDLEASDNLADQFLCHEYSESRCGMDTCNCDLHFARSIITYLNNPGNSISGTLHHYKMLEECKPPVAKPVVTAEKQEKKIDVDLNDDLVDALENLNKNLDSLSAPVKIKQANQKGMNLLFNSGTGLEEDEQEIFLEEELDVALTHLHQNDECCGEAPLWQPYSTQVHECKNNRICLLGQCPF